MRGVKSHIFARKFKDDEGCRRLEKVPGVGPLIATAAGMLEVRKVDVRENNFKTCHTTNRPCLKPDDKAFDANNDKKFHHWRATVPVI